MAGSTNAGRVVMIQLQNSDLTGDVPEAFGGLTALTRLELSGNKLTSVPAELGGLTALKTLYLSGNQLTSVPAELGALTALTRLDLDGNQLTSVPAELGALTATAACFSSSRCARTRNNALLRVPGCQGGAAKSRVTQD
jgi:Leucine-rich repeat (LRR) protein